MPRTLFLSGHVYSPVDPFATALMVVDGEIAWVGQDGAARAAAGAGDEIVDLRGALVTPGFVDAHVHHTSAGLAITGVELSGCTSARDVLDAMSTAAADAAMDAVLLGHGWDESSWADPRLPTRGELDAAVGGRSAYAARTDVHSALVSTALLDLAGATASPDVAVVRREEHHRVRRTALASVTIEQRRTAIRALRRRAAESGVVALHECAGPDISGRPDLQVVLDTVADEPGPLAVLYWGDVAGGDGGNDARSALPLGASGLAGDLFVDGSLGSRTAFLGHEYADAPGTRGAPYLDVDAVGRHVLACTRAGMQAGFHVIGDAAMEIVVAGLLHAADVEGADAVRAARHRLEHVESVTQAQGAVLADLGVVASMQPVFDAWWGGAGGMYEQRLGPDRARRLNPFAQLSAAGVTLAFGSDAPVTPVDPWEAVRAAAFHHEPEHRISVRAAFAAHTRGGHRAARDDTAGVLVPGAPAHLAIWAPSELVVQAPDDRVAAWSTDPRSGTPGLPDLTPGRPLPTCVRTVVAGRVIHDSGWLS